MKTGTWNRSLLVGIVFLFLLPTAFAQINPWFTDDGMAIRQGRHVTMGMNAVADDGQGSILITWCDARTGSMDVYAQLYSPSGETLWPGEDLAIAATEYPDQDPKAIHTSDGNWIIAWQDFRNDVDQLGVGEIYLTKLDAFGNPVWEQPVGPIGGSLSYFYRWGVHPDDLGGATLFWRNDNRLQLQRVSADGNLMWETIPDMSLDYSAHDPVTFTGDGGAVVMLRKNRDVTTPEIRVQKINPDGSYAWGGEADGLLLDSHSNTDRMIMVNPVELSDDSWVLAWFESSINTLYAQKVTPEGDMLWEDETVVSSAMRHLDYRSATAIDDNHVVYFCRDDVQATAFDFSGDAPEVAWQADALDGSNVAELVTTSLPDGDLLVTWAGYTESSPQIQSHRLTQDGSWVWDQVQLLGSFGQIVHFGTVLLNNEVVTVWSGNQEGLQGVRMQCQNLESGICENELPIPVIEGISDQTYEPIIARSDNNAIICWIDYRRYPGGEMYYQVVDWQTGEQRNAWNGAPLVEWLPIEENSTRSVGQIQILPDGQGGAVLTWESETRSSTDVTYLMGQRINAQGERLWGEDGRILGIFAESAHEYLNQYKTILIDDEVFAVASAVSVIEHGWTPAPAVSWYDMQGNRLDADLFFPELEGDLRTGFYLEVFPAEEGDIILSFIARTLDQETNASYYMRIAQPGQVVWTASNILETSFQMVDRVQLPATGAISTLINTTGDQGALYAESISLDGEWLQEPMTTITENELYRDDTYFRIDPTTGDVVQFSYSTAEVQFRRYGIDGSVLVSEEDEVMIGSGDYIADLVFDPEGGMYVVSIDFSMNVDTNIFFTYITPSGEPMSDLYDGTRLTVVDAPFEQSQLYTIPDGEGGFAMVWNDWRGSLVAEPQDDVYAFRYNDFTTAVTGEQTITLPGDFALLPAYPNPFNPSTTLTYTVPRNGKIRLAVYDLLGREVVRLVDGVQEAGTYHQVWQATSRNGMTVSTGTYFVRYDTPQGTQAQKVLLLK